MEISIVVPCYNEVENINEFWTRLSRVVDSDSSNWEAIFVNDGSQDETLSVLKKLQITNPAIVIVDLSRNFGKEAAITAGLDQSRGEAVIIIDGDLQHPPEVIPEMLELWKKGAEVVVCRRRSRETDSLLRRWLSRQFYSISNRLFEVNLPRDVGDFRLMTRPVVDALSQLTETQRFMKGLFSWIGFEQKVIEFDVADRAAGSSSFSVWKLWNFAWEGITSFSTVPLRIWFYIGVLISFLSFVYGLFILIATIFIGTSAPGYPSIMVMIAFIGGIQLIGIGVLGEYIGRTYNESKSRPLYIIRQTFRS